jgi:hypothetical protein
MHEPGWISFYSAAADIRQRCGGSLADAQGRLRHACADGRMRSMKAPLDPEVLPLEYWTGLAPSEWRVREPDYDGPDADGCEVVVMINEDDFRPWLNALPTPAADNRRDAAIRKLLEAGVRTGKVFYNKVRDEADGWRARGVAAYSFSDKQIKRASKKIEATIVRKPKAAFLQRRDK